MKTTLVLGSGHQPFKRLRVTGPATYHFEKVYPDEEAITTIDIVARSQIDPTICHDLNRVPWPIVDNHYDEVHAYEILEHLGRQGDLTSFFATFNEIYRVLKPGGQLYASVPAFDSVWAWGDPGHTRIINAGTLVFLSHEQYYQQLGNTAMSDYRHLCQCDFETVFHKMDGDSFVFVLRALK